uniref:Flavin-containing monooxygenase n=1 Tax=Leptobrachium leishanense TaxID=445787 RepID=A0A8C5PP99_9ANUR
MVKTVAIIGAGMSGLAAVKGCLEDGLEPTCFERTAGIGGLWRFTTTVCHVQRHSDFSMTGKWVIVTKTGEESNTAIFDAVMICTGQYIQPVLPLESFPGIDKFRGKVFHSRHYKRPVGFDGKKVLIIGMGNTGVDISTELCTRTSQVYLSTKRGVCVLRRLGEEGYPLDLSFITRFRNYIHCSLPTALARLSASRYANQQFNHSLYNIQTESILSKELLVNEELPSRILAGLIIMKPGVTRFTETSAHFADGTSIDDLDVVIFATGYDITFPFLEESVIKMDPSKGFLYKKMFPVNLQKPTIAFIGFIQPIGAIAVTAELQCRWATKFFKGLVKMPSTEEMKDYLAEDEKLRLKWFETTQQNWRRTNYIKYVDDLAADINVKPNIWKLILTDPVLGFKMFFGPINGYQYRLTGPHKWIGAREAILTQWDRIEKPLRTRGMKKPCSSLFTFLPSLMPWFLCIVALCAAILIKG